MKVIELKQFIKTGVFDSVRIGISKKQDVINLMGNTFEYANCGETQIIKYGWFEFFYWTKNETIFGIQNDHLQFDCMNHNEMIYFENKNIKIDNWFLQANKNITFSELVNTLKQENIDFQLKRENYEDAIQYIELSNGITLDFDNQLTTWLYDDKNDERDIKKELITKEENYILNAIRLFKY